MGFLEELSRLKQQRDAGRQRVAEEATRLAATRQQQEEAIRLAEEQERARLRQEREQAEVFWNQSAFSKLAKEIVSLAEGLVLVERPMRLIPGEYDGPYNHAPDRASHAYRYNRLENNQVIKNLPGMTLVWTGEKVNFRRMKYGHSEWEQIYNVVVVTCDYQGTIVANGESLPLSLWRGNSNIQEEVLGEAYENPYTFYERDNDIPPSAPQYDSLGMG